MNRAFWIFLLAPLAYAQDPSSPAPELPPLPTDDDAPSEEEREDSASEDLEPAMQPAPPVSVPRSTPPDSSMSPAPSAREIPRSPPPSAAKGPPEVGRTFVALHGGGFVSESQVWQLASSSPPILDYGVIGGIGLSRWFTLTTETSHFRGRKITTSDAWNAYQSSFYNHQAGVGLRVHPDYGELGQPYAQATVVGSLGHLHLDDDVNRVRSDREIRSTALSLGLRAVVGVELRVVLDSQVEPVIAFEVGYTGLVPHQHHLLDRDGDRVAVGRMSYSSPMVRALGGVRF
ncbi:MAG: hypothetical protein EA397_06860 [Deltaproteobacteria bacterium]|nr:MAG: hypothetical protein EA397_06860 [Deltaproteobacteria bacterium]